jgi:tetratricopeptide (TPR) repeat protein
MLDEYAQARGRYEAALPIYQAIGDRLGEMNCYFGLADLDRQAEDWPAAAAKYAQALDYYRAIGMAFNVALALQRLGHTAAGAGDVEQARRCYQESLEIFTRIGSPMAKEVQANLDGLAAMA